MKNAGLLTSTKCKSTFTTMLHKCLANDEGSAGEVSHISSSEFDADLVFIFIILVAPRCKQGYAPSYQVSLNEQVDVLCEVEANPGIDQFYWSLNSSDKISHISPSDFTANQFSSLLHYQLRRKRDFGILSCFSKNSIGTQKKPCLYILTRLGKSTYIIMFLIYSPFIYCHR